MTAIAVHVPKARNMYCRQLPICDVEQRRPTNLHDINLSTIIRVESSLLNEIHQDHQHGPEIVNVYRQSLKTT